MLQEVQFLPFMKAVEQVRQEVEARKGFTEFENGTHLRVFSFIEGSPDGLTFELTNYSLGGKQLAVFGKPEVIQKVIQAAQQSVA